MSCMSSNPAHHTPARPPTHLRKCARAVVLDFVVPQVQLAQHLALCCAQAAASDDGAIIAQAIAAQVKLQ